MLPSTNFVEIILPQNCDSFLAVVFGSYLMFSIAVIIEVALFSGTVNNPFVKSILIKQVLFGDVRKTFVYYKTVFY